jgi:peptidoglycan/LPS O-acetylase OafA/YrhL
MLQSPGSAPARPDPVESGFRPDVEGLRGVAVLLVVLFHAGLPFSGGFIGVDVFFVISGFLITGLLLREHERAGRVSLSRFYARRVRRLLPAAAVVVLATLAGTWLVVNPLDRPSAMTDGATAVLSVANVRFALLEGDYFTALAQPSPFLHFWSLSVEEQFYLVWPALLFLVARGRRRWVALALGLVLVGSFVASVALTQSAITWAYYSLPTRAWQLATGGLLAVGAAAIGSSVPRVVRALAGVLGWAAIVVLVGAGFVLSDAVAYPGLFALAPTVASAVLIASGTVTGGPGLLLGVGPLRFLGRISYSLYLWHWPILVLAPLALGRALSLPEGVALALVAVVVAWLSWRFVEEPFRRGRLAVAFDTRRALQGGLAAIAAVAMTAGGLDLGSQRAIDAIAYVEPEPTAGAYPSAEPTLQPAVSPGVTSEPGATALPSPTAAPTAPTLEPLLGWRDIPDVSIDAPIPLTSRVRPRLADARDDAGSLGWRCVSQAEDVNPADCVFGKKDGAVTIALVGDSHAGSWFPAFESVAKAMGWRLLPFVKNSCPFIDVPVQNYLLKRDYPECAAWRDEVIERLGQVRPDLTVIAMSHRGIFPLADADKGVKPESAAIARAMVRIPGRLAIMVDTPRTSTDVPACIADHAADVRPCAITRSSAFDYLFAAREERVAKSTGAALIDLTSAVCPGAPCQVIVRGMIVYRDNHHLTATFSASLGPVLERELLRSFPTLGR